MQGVKGGRGFSTHATRRLSGSLCGLHFAHIVVHVNPTCTTLGYPTEVEHTTLIAARPSTDIQNVSHLVVACVLLFDGRFVPL